MTQVLIHQAHRQRFIARFGPPITTSLKELKSAGIVRCERRGRSLRYRPDFASMNQLLAFLTEHCCEGCEGPPS